ncbi:MAG TPA: redoxin family protein [Ohtaekwangia sp.]|uniref:DUF6436 domain-containing protein n=1 Tax=Ohtaekwangia sp. TaxID=2066019 RepID=UPI002F944A61
MVRVAIVVLMLMGCSTGVAVLFWQQDAKYSLPTPVPADYKEVTIGQAVQLPASLGKQRAYFFHFYNPDCPCSRFNARYIQSLIRSYRSEVAFTIVVSSEEGRQQAADTFGEDIPIVTDTQQAIATACGVYSTPQAAIVDADGKLYYRGNYNRARYCTTKASNFAELSLLALLNHQPSPAFGIVATQSYGCSLPGDESSSAPILF